MKPGLLKGMLYALPLSLVLWALIIGAVWLGVSLAH